MIPIESKNAKLLAEFTEYCVANPDKRFWQCVRNWCGEPYVFIGDLNDGVSQAIEQLGLRDTFYWENKND